MSRNSKERQVATPSPQSPDAQGNGTAKQSDADSPKRLIILYDRSTGGAQLFTHSFEKVSKVQFRKRYEVLVPLTLYQSDGTSFDPSVLLAFDRSNGAGVIYQVTHGGEFKGLQKFVGWTQNWSSVCALSDGRVMFHSQRGAYTECQSLVPAAQEVKRQPGTGGKSGTQMRYSFKMQALWTVADDIFDALLPYTTPDGQSFVLLLNRKSMDTQGRVEPGRVTALTSDGGLPVEGSPPSCRAELQFSWDSVITDGYGLLFFYDRRSEVSYTVRLNVARGRAVRIDHLRSFPQTRGSWQSMTFVTSKPTDPTVSLLLHDRDQAQAQVFDVDRVTGKMELTRVIQHDTTTHIRFDYVNALAVNLPSE